MKRINEKHNPFKAANVVQHALFSIGTEAVNAITVGIQLQDANYRDLAVRAAVECYLSDDANGDSIVATAMTSALSAGTDGVVESRTTGKSARLISEADGDIDLVLTYTTGAKTCYLVLIMPDGSLVVSGAITFAS